MVSTHFRCMVGSLTSWSTEQLCLSEMNIFVCSAGSGFLASGHLQIWKWRYLNISPSCGAEKMNAKIQARNICQKLDIFKGQLVMEMEVMFNASLHKSLKFTSPLTMMTWQIENPLKVCNFDKYVKLFLELFYFFLLFKKNWISMCFLFSRLSLSRNLYIIYGNEK